jgi:serine/threonine protein kinase
MVTPHDHAKVLDLGLAFTEGEEVDDIEVVGGKGYIVGSIDYMAPEQTRDPTNIDARADLYALGCCLYYALTGKPPFPEGSVIDKVKAQRREEPVPIRERNSQVPETFALIIQRLMAKSPTDRFASAGDVEAVLASWRSGNEKPLDTPGDLAFQQWVQTIINSWVEPAIKEPGEDAAVFHIEPEDASATTEFLSRAIFKDIDRFDPRIWVIVLVALFAGVLLICVSAACVLAMMQR